jgi:competence protein ComGC
MILPEKPSPRAFSVIESLVVILIILLLTSIVIPGLMGKTKEETKRPKGQPPAGKTVVPRAKADPVPAPTAKTVPPQPAPDPGLDP